MARFSRSALEELRRSISDRDLAILGELLKCRYLRTDQIQRLCFTGNANPTAALRAASRGLASLQGYGLVESLSRRIGGVRAGSGGYVWLLTDAGDRLLHLFDYSYKPRKRFFEPSLAFLRHTLAISEAYVRLTGTCGGKKLSLVTCDLEPLCWRSYGHTASKRLTLKPDLYAVTETAEYVDHWFVEIDLDTEAPAVVLDKCRRYAEYCDTKAEQQASGGPFPLVVWVVPGGKRKSSLTREIAACPDLRHKNIFTVILPDEFEPLIESGADMKGENCG